ncbi:MAG TPA: riboflavin synthase [Treponemataceae bacterium]|nr:riboflavin synthase [Treponemataceae bacterium]
MFTGLIEAQGSVSSLIRQREHTAMTIYAPTIAHNLANGDSVAVNGVCLTVIKTNRTHFSADISRETLCRTTFTSLMAGSPVNLERAMRADDRFNGHFVSGHVDAVASVLRIETQGNFQVITFTIPTSLSPLICEKGSVAIDGISLTVSKCYDTCFSISLIPHTLKHTTLHHATCGLLVNLECDILARYLAPKEDRATINNRYIRLLATSGFMGRSYE